MDNTEKNKLLLVDDDTASLLELIDILKPEYKIYTAKDGLSAIQIAEEYLPDLILLDINMPGMSGYDVLSKLQKSDSAAGIPVIFVTGFNSSDDEQKGFSLGAVDYIAKPFRRIIVKQKVFNHIQIVNLRRELEAARVR